ncbi:dihydropteroate synthase [Blastopirellula marina]|uniref:Dihydropteroate synthase n=1 Tax=Blastopirellula marina TaxID=124 RepID=A0A2S8FTA0_9BACT|nr:MULTISPECIES: DUF6513 domain-containing protein [Pirellulaceae]PQO35280.1 dihydropteroate synthase [Blastopirellula marina]RCS53149.1 dihydropteroate synthase [Bremerella cremea]
MPQPHIHFVTGKLAESSLRNVLAQLAPKAGFDYSVQVLNITVAALMTADWIARRIQVPPEATQVMVTGYCRGDLKLIEGVAMVPVQLGPKDLRQLPDWFDQPALADDYGEYDIEIIAEINHAPSFNLAEIVAEGIELRAAGADRIDVGCDPGSIWTGVADCVKALCDEGLQVSVDSLNPGEIAPAVKAGASLVLSVNSSNREYAADWGCEVVVIPDDPKSLKGFDETINYLVGKSVPFRLDPILEPISFGFTESIVRYYETRRRYPDAEMMMGIGNLTELTDADSAGINVMLLGVCQELGIRSVLTTQVINWARTSVRECDLARRLMRYAIEHRTLPKRIEPKLVTLRDPKVSEPSPEELALLPQQLKDKNYRLFVAQQMLHMICSDLHLQDDDPFSLFEKLEATSPTNLNPSHAFYLGFELCKAMTAMHLGKQYRQDEALDWGYLTHAEESHRINLHKDHRKDAKATEADDAS